MGNGYDNDQGIIHRVRDGGTLWQLFDRAITAYEARTQIIQQQSVETGMIGSRLENIHAAVFEINGKVDTMSSNIDRIEKEAADAAENVGLVKAAVEGLNTIVTDLKAEVASLKEQVAQGQLDQARLDAAATTLEKADDDIDAIVLPKS